MVLILSCVCQKYAQDIQVEYGLFLELDESITLIRVLSVCVAKEFISIL